MQNDKLQRKKKKSTGSLLLPELCKSRSPRTGPWFRSAPREESAKAWLAPSRWWIKVVRSLVACGTGLDRGPWSRVTVKKRCFRPSNGHYFYANNGTRSACQTAGVTRVEHRLPRFTCFHFFFYFIEYYCTFSLNENAGHGNFSKFR